MSDTLPTLTIYLVDGEVISAPVTEPMTQDESTSAMLGLLKVDRMSLVDYDGLTWGFTLDKVSSMTISGTTPDE